ncbi:MAG: hypothetical protein JW703_04340 [Candidatus Diapherotrites archaeon]|nr:hypothetical protein [Candidatus Diapherotrites archaeon]
MLNKGYIGSIGDDLPSLIPLLFALLIFFSVFSFTLNLFNEKKALFEREFELMRIADSMKYDGYINGFEEYLLDSYGNPLEDSYGNIILLPNTFTSLCGSVSVTRTKFRAGLTNHLTAPELYLNEGIKFDLFGDIFYSDELGNEFVCSNTSFDDFESLKSKKSPNMIVRLYPVVLDEKKVIKPMHLVVVSWQ